MLTPLNSCPVFRGGGRESNLELDLRYVVESTLAGVSEPEVELKILDLKDKGHKGLSVCADLALLEGQAVTFVLRTPPSGKYPHAATKPNAQTAEALGVPLESE